jgi:NAD(P)-dependent dehydrogenase (short-subunit alcohol dehydrogenase family)
VRDESSVARAIDEAWTRLDAIDMLGNDAGDRHAHRQPALPDAPTGLLGGPIDGFRAVIETNLTGYFLVAREVTPRMLAADGGRIVNGLCSGPSSRTGRATMPQAQPATAVQRRTAALEVSR